MGIQKLVVTIEHNYSLVYLYCVCSCRRNSGILVHNLKIGS